MYCLFRRRICCRFTMTRWRSWWKTFLFWMAIPKGWHFYTTLDQIIVHWCPANHILFSLFVQQGLLWTLPLVCLVVVLFLVSRTRLLCVVKGCWVILRLFSILPGQTLYSGVAPWIFLFHILSCFHKARMISGNAHQQVIHLKRLQLILMRKKASH